MRPRSLTTLAALFVALLVTGASHAAPRDLTGERLNAAAEAPRPPSPANRHVRVVWLFNSEQAWRAMAPNVAHIGRSAYIHPG